MEAALVPYVAQKRMAGKEHKVEYAQLKVKSGSEKSWPENAHIIIIDQPEEVLIESDLGVYNGDYGDHEHSGNITVTNYSTTDIILSFIRLIPQ